MTSKSNPLHQAECPRKCYWNSWHWQSVKKCQHIEFNCQGITQKKEHN